VYESRPLVCRLFPFYLEPLTGDATLLPVQCGDRLHVLQNRGESGGWSLSDLEATAEEWCSELWREAVAKKQTLESLQSDEQ
jgi:Fe-S-cluster containining protein